VDVTVVVATFGDAGWADTARRRAVASARTLGVPVVHVHGDTLHGARNAGLERVRTGWVVHLDADDELEAGYLQAMGRARGDVRVPRVRYCRPGMPPPAAVMPRVAGHRHVCTQRCLPAGNWIVVGAAVRAGLVRQVGGWRDFGWEDWDLWLRCHQAGACIRPAPDAVYRAWVRTGSRGRYSRAESLRHHRAVAAANGVPAP